VGYVRALSGLSPKQATPNRADAMEGAPPENRRKPTPRRPEAAEMMPATVARAVARRALARGTAGRRTSRQLWWILVPVCAAVFVVVMIAALWALRRAPARGSGHAARRPRSRIAAREKRLARRVGLRGGALIGAAGGASAGQHQPDRALATLPVQDAVNLRVVAHQWWWEVTYDDANPGACSRPPTRSTCRWGGR
jgi:heme/copper-type cytochrome/quinol oxidase subunit 2